MTEGRVTDEHFKGACVQKYLHHHHYRRIITILTLTMMGKKYRTYVLCMYNSTVQYESMDCTDMYVCSVCVTVCALLHRYVLILGTLTYLHQSGRGRGETVWRREKLFVPRAVHCTRAKIKRQRQSMYSPGTASEQRHTARRYADSGRTKCAS